MRIKLVKKKDYKELQRLKRHFDIGANGEICIAVGGDGTFIKAAQATDRPILLIRDDEDGSLGYYSDITLKDLDFAIQKLIKKDFYVEQISSKIALTHKNSHYYAINEASLNNISEEISYRIYKVTKNGRSKIYPFIMSGDGLIVTGALGSTAYNKSAGGPIILAQNVMCLTFLNPDGPYRNSIVVDADTEIEVEIVKYKGVLRYDGIEVARLKPGDTFRVKLSDKKINTVKFKGKTESFSDKLERKIKAKMRKEFRD